MTPHSPDHLPVSIAIFTQQVSNYHAARFRSAAKRFRQVTVISAMNDADFQEFLAADVAGIDAIRLCTGRLSYLQSVADGRIWSMTARLLASVSPDIVAVAGWAFPESLAALAWARRNRVPVVMMSASQRHDGARSSLREFIKSRVVKLCQSSLVGGRTQADYIRILGMPDGQIFHGYDVVDNDHFSQGASRAQANAEALRKQLDLPDRYLLASARFIGKKNLPRLIAAFADALQKSGTEHHLVIIGDGPERLPIETAIREARLEKRVHLPGFRGYDELPTYYGLAEAFIHVSLSEQWGLVVNEAAAAGLPVVVSRPCGAATEIVEHGGSGYLVDPTEAASISAALTRIMLSSSTKRAAMGDRSRQLVAAWGPDRFAEGLFRAALTGLAAPCGPAAVWDKAILHILSRRAMSTVT